MLSLNKEVGTYGECEALKYLKKSGYIIIERNFRSKYGEIDLIAKDGDYITFVEVKLRYGKLYGTPSESITYSKQLKIYRTAQYYIMKKKLYDNYFRFDVIEIFLLHDKENIGINLIKNAFQI
jgi:putative endonuclease